MKPEFKEYEERRKKFQGQMDDLSVAFFFSPPPALKSNDVHYPYRTDSDLFYLTGFPEENVILVLYNDSSILYLRKRDPDMEVWNGLRLGIEKACEVLGVDEARDYENFKKELPELIRNKKNIYHSYGTNPGNDSLILETNAGILKRARNGEYGPVKITHLSSLIHEMRIIKDEAEIKLMKECAEITREAHVHAMQMVRPGMYEYELDGAIQQIFKKHGGDFAYPSIVASGNHACILHYIENNAVIREEDLILIDAGVEKNCINADVTRTFPASGKFSPAQKAVYEIVLASQKKAISLMTENGNLEDVHQGTVRILTEGLLDLGLLTGSIDENIEKHHYRKFYMHKTGHWLGRDVHDVGNYFENGSVRKLKNGMVATVEPGLYIDKNLSDIKDEFRGIGIRIEDDILIHGNQPVNLTASIPKEIHEIEEIIKNGKS